MEWATLVASMTEADQLRALRWLAERQGRASALHDSDLMVEMGLGVEQAQSLLLSLQARGEIEFHNLVLESGGHSLGRLRIRKLGLHRLALAQREAEAAQEAAGSLAHRRPRGLRRITSWFSSGRSR